MIIQIIDKADNQLLESVDSYNLNPLSIDKGLINLLQGDTYYSKDYTEYRVLDAKLNQQKNKKIVLVQQVIISDSLWIQSPIINSIN